MEDRDMLEIDIKLVPFGIKDRERVIARMTIWNDASGDHETGNYGYKIVTDRDEEYSGEYKNFPRKDGALKLCRNILNQIKT